MFLAKIVKAAQRHVKNPRALGYLRERGVSAEQIKTFGLGYFPREEWPPYVSPEGDEEQRLYNEWSRRGYGLRGKLVFPMTNAAGRLGGIQVRTPEEDIKDYSKFYTKRSSVDGLFFGANAAMPSIWGRREVYLCEGIFDFFPLQRVFPNTLCTGTANVGRDQMEFLQRYVDHVYVVFDRDWGGDRFWKRFETEEGSKFKTVQRINVVGKDVSEMWKRLGEHRFREVITSHQLF